MIRRPPRSTRTDTLFPYTTLFRSLAALGLAAFTVIATLIGHTFWTFEGADFHRQLTTDLEHLSVVGGFLALTAHGAGRLSVSHRKAPHYQRSLSECSIPHQVGMADRKSVSSGKSKSRRGELG